MYLIDGRKSSRSTSGSARMSGLLISDRAMQARAVPATMHAWRDQKINSHCHSATTSKCFRFFTTSCPDLSDLHLLSSFLPFVLFFSRPF